MRYSLSLLLALVFGARAFAAEPLFEDRVIVKGKGVEIKKSQLDETFIQFKANRAAIGESIPRTTEELKAAEAEILDNMIGARLLMARATDEDRAKGAEDANKFIENRKKAAGNDATYKRQLVISGVTVEAFEREVKDQAVIKAVVDREVRPTIKVTDEDVANYYKENPRQFEDPEKWKVAHIYLSNRDRFTREVISEKQKAEKKAKLADLLIRAKSGVDFAKLAKENSEHSLTKDNGGEQTFTNGQMPPEFEAAALSMKPGQVSDIVATGLGWHIIKFIEHIPAKQIDFESSKDRIRQMLVQRATQQALPAYIKQLRQEAGVEVIQ